MFRLVAAFLIIGQFVLVGSGLVWLAGKIGFKPAIPYAIKVEQTFHQVKSKVF